MSCRRSTNSVGNFWARAFFVVRYNGFRLGNPGAPKYSAPTVDCASQLLFLGQVGSELVESACQALLHEDHAAFESLQLLFGGVDRDAMEVERGLASLLGELQGVQD